MYHQGFQRRPFFLSGLRHNCIPHLLPCLPRCWTMSKHYWAGVYDVSIRELAYFEEDTMDGAVAAKRNWGKCMNWDLIYQKPMTPSAMLVLTSEHHGGVLWTCCGWWRCWFPLSLELEHLWWAALSIPVFSTERIKSLGTAAWEMLTRECCRSEHSRRVCRKD